MRHGTRVLYLLRPDEARPPDTLLRAAGSLHLARAGNPVDAAARDYGPQIIAIHGPYDHEARVALDEVVNLELPMLCYGNPPVDSPLVCVSEHITVEDLRTVLDLMVHIATLHQLSPTECRAEDAGQCRGKVVEDTIRLLEHLVRLRIPDSAERSARVLEASLWIANHLCLPPHEIKDIARAARLREIGKLALPDRLLFTRRDQRAPGDQQAYDMYPALGARVLREFPPLRVVSKLVEHQLENFDGTGPANLMAHQIPLGSRILRVAGAFSMMLNPNDLARSVPDVIGVLDSGRGSLYDPLLVKLVENYFRVAETEMAKRRTKLVRITDLQEGMVLAEDVWSRTGMKIIPSGTRITPRLLSLLSQYPLDPALEAVQVLM